MNPRSGDPIPTRSRLNCSLPSSSMTDPRPLWPPDPPPSRKRSLPNGRAKSSQTTSSSLSGACSRARTLRTASPESFIHVSGLTIVRSQPAVAAAPRSTPRRASGRARTSRPGRRSRRAPSSRRCGASSRTGRPGSPGRRRSSRTLQDGGSARRDGQFDRTIAATPNGPWIPPCGRARVIYQCRRADPTPWRRTRPGQRRACQNAAHELASRATPTPGGSIPNARERASLPRATSGAAPRSICSSRRRSSRWPP